MYLMYELDEEFSEYMDEMIAATKQTNWGFHDEEVIINNWNIIFWYMSIDIDKFTTEHMGITLSDTVFENQNIEHVFFGYPTVSNCTFRNCRVYMSEISECTMKDCVFENCTFICSAFDDSCTMINVTFNDCKFIDSEVCVDYRHRLVYDEVCKRYYKRYGLENDHNHVEYNNCIHSYIATEDPYVE